MVSMVGKNIHTLYLSIIINQVEPVAVSINNCLGLASTRQDYYQQLY